jgi:hypothetical protein
VLKSAGAITKAYIMYKPYVIFTFFAVLLGVLGLIPFVRYAILKAVGDDGNHIQSLLVGTILLVMSFMSIIVGIIGDLLRTNRALIEDTLEHTKKMRFGMLDPSSPGAGRRRRARRAPAPRRPVRSEPVARRRAG